MMYPCLQQLHLHSTIKHPHYVLTKWSIHMKTLIWENNPRIGNRSSSKVSLSALSGVPLLDLPHMFSLCGVEVYTGTSHIGSSMRQRRDRGGGSRIKRFIKLLHLLVDRHITPWPALDFEWLWVKKCHLKGKHIQQPFKYCSTEVVPPPSKKFTWQLAPQRGIVINADCSDSQWKTEGAETVWKISAGTGHLHKGMLLRGVLWPKGAIYF